jgi:hypothetical protein
MLWVVRQLRWAAQCEELWIMFHYLAHSSQKRA